MLRGDELGGELARPPRPQPKGAVGRHVPTVETLHVSHMRTKVGDDVVRRSKGGAEVPRVEDPHGGVEDLEVAGVGVAEWNSTPLDKSKKFVEKP